MQKFTKVKGTAAPLAMVNVDTDKIIPKQFLKTIKRTGLGRYLFNDMRFTPDGKEIPNFVLNQSAYRKAEILVAGENFGCGSSREHAPWALLDFGIRCVIAPSFADIFYNNCFKNGVLPLVLPKQQVDKLMELAQKPGTQITVDLETQTVSAYPDNTNFSFALDPFRRHCLLNGLDDIGLTEQRAGDIAAYEKKAENGEAVAVKQILLLPGDGIGPEVMAEARRVLEWFRDNCKLEIEISEALIGGASIDANGVPLTPEVLAKAKQADAILLGAVGGPKWAKIAYDKRPEQGLLSLRKELELFANLRPAIVFDALIDASTLKPEVIRSLDILIVRELTGGVYFGEPRGITDIGNGQRRGVNTQVYTTAEIVRIARVAFELARKRKNKVCSCEKSNVMESGMLWREEVTKLHDIEYTDVQLTHMLADNCAMQLLSAPNQFDVIVTDNLFGDILSDEAAMLTGSLGMLPSASLGAMGADGKQRAMYEPIHGSAPDIAAQDKANPLATILSAAMMFRYSFGWEKEADMLELAVRSVLDSAIRTADILSPGLKPVGTKTMGDAVLMALDKIA